MLFSFWLICIVFQLFQGTIITPIVVDFAAFVTFATNKAFIYKPLSFNFVIPHVISRLNFIDPCCPQINVISNQPILKLERYQLTKCQHKKAFLPYVSFYYEEDDLNLVWCLTWNGFRYLNSIGQNAPCLVTMHIQIFKLYCGLLLIS